MFIGRHFEIGELYMEYLKGSCTDSGDLCEWCSSHVWVGPQLLRVPKPYPDYSRLPSYHYLPGKDTPTNVDGKKREVDDMQPRVQLKKLHKNGGDADIAEFCNKYIGKEVCAKKYLQHLDVLFLKKDKRKKGKVCEK